MRLIGRRLHIAGSANKNIDPAKIVHAHDIVRQLVRMALQEGATLVMQAGPEPRVDDTDSLSPALVFDWTIAEEVHAYLSQGNVAPVLSGDHLIYAVNSEKADADIPISRRNLWDALLDSGAVNLARIRVGSRSGASIRELQAREGNVLVTLGGGAGVEHLAELYLGRHLPFIPLDAQLGASRNDGMLGGEGLARRALTNPTRFFRLHRSGTEAAKLSSISTREGGANSNELVNRLINLIADLERPTAFFVRLVNRDHDDFQSVESFFRDIVEPVVNRAGYKRHEVGTDDTSRAFMNMEIFEILHQSPLAIVDLTALRPNCLMELGYALRGDGKVLITARKGTQPPFDPAALQWHFWQNEIGDAAGQAAFEEYWRKNFNRPPLVQNSVTF